MIFVLIWWYNFFCIYIWLCDLYVIIIMIVEFIFMKVVYKGGGGNRCVVVGWISSWKKYICEKYFFVIFLMCYIKIVFWCVI